MSDFLCTVLALSLGASMMAALLYGMKLLMGHRLSSTVYYYLWLLVLLRFVLPIPGFMPTGTEQNPTPATEQRELMNTYSERVHRAYIEPETARTYYGYDKPISDAAKPTAVQKSDTESFVISRPDMVNVVFALWLLGTLISLMHSLLSYLRFARNLRREALSPEAWEYECYRSIRPGKKPGLIKSLYVSTPMLMGLFSPCLVLPEREYNKETLKNIFLHELKHHTRHDLAYKWFTVLALSLHWFNPLTYLIRGEINRACETSCDEMLISRMDRAERRSYGETLISLAARRPLPMGIVATSFAMEKRDLKERLTKIMKHKKKSIIAALMCVLLLAGCGAAVGPGAEVQETQPTPESIRISTEDVFTAGDELNIVKVSNVDELIAAIGSDRVICLDSGEYELSAAEGFGTASGENWYWRECYDGFELVIHDVENLEFMGQEGAEIVTRPRYANVMNFVSCSNVSLVTLTLGHTVEDGFCTGGVVSLDSCAAVSLHGAKLYGCGTVGLFAENCEDVYAVGCEIYDCSNYGVSAVSCKNVLIEQSRLHSNRDGYFQCVFRAESCDGFTALNCGIYDNEAQNLLTSAYSTQVSLLGCKVEGNTFKSSVIHAVGYSPVIDKCSIPDAEKFLLYANLPAVNTDGEELTRDDIAAMVQSEATYEGPAELPPVELDEFRTEEGRREVTVSTVDEFLAAIDDNTTIKLDAELFDLSTASDYGSYGGGNYYWINSFDGPSLVINGVEGLSIVAENDCTIAAIPRYANVMSFINCENITLSGFTAGHTEEPGQCAGGVLDFQDCWGIGIDNCRLYGCGILGISSRSCSELRVQDTEIYDCSQGAISLSTTMDASFDNMNIHDCHTPELYLYGCMNVKFEGEDLIDGSYITNSGKAKEFVFPPING